MARVTIYHYRHRGLGLLLHQPQHNRIYTRHERKHGRGYISSIWKWQSRCLLDLCSHELAQWELGYWGTDWSCWFHNSRCCRINGIGARISGREEDFRQRRWVLHCCSKFQHAVFGGWCTALVGVLCHDWILSVLCGHSGGLALVSHSATETT